MFLSRLLVDPLSPVPARVLACPYVLHQAIMSGFDPARRGNSRVLFRVEPERPRGSVVILVQSEMEPEWQPTLTRFFPGAALPDVKPFEISLCDGETLRFRLRANPTVRRDGKRLGLTGEEAFRAWLERKLAAAGAVPCGVQVRDEGLVRGRQQPVQFQSVRFDGVLMVQDAAGLTEAAQHGIGSAKAFGFGLLSFARLPEQ
jgi:CRISPR system Cascade subunit CasE